MKNAFIQYQLVLFFVLAGLAYVVEQSLFTEYTLEPVEIDFERDFEERVEVKEKNNALRGVFDSNNDFFSRNETIAITHEKINSSFVLKERECSFMNNTPLYILFCNSRICA
jgi:hypothetical protein